MRQEKKKKKGFEKQPSGKSLLCYLNVEGDNLVKGMQEPLSDKKDCKWNLSLRKVVSIRKLLLKGFSTV